MSDAYPPQPPLGSAEQPSSEVTVAAPPGPPPQRPLGSSEHPFSDVSGLGAWRPFGSIEGLSAQSRRKADQSLLTKSPESRLTDQADSSMSAASTDASPGERTARARKRRIVERLREDRNMESPQPGGRTGAASMAARSPLPGDIVPQNDEKYRER